MTRSKITVVGDALLDRDVCGDAQRLCPDAPVPVIDEPTADSRPGGAGLAALLAAADGAEVTLVAPLADDAAGAELAAALHAGGVELVALELEGSTAEKVRIRAGGQPVARLDYGVVRRIAPPSAQAVAAIADADAVLVSDYGRGVTSVAGIRAALEQRGAARPAVWDPHPRGAPPVAAMRLVTPNAAEALRLVGGGAADLTGLTAAGAALRRRWKAGGVAVTCGPRGAVLIAADGTPLAVPAPQRVGAGYACGAGDRFAAAATSALARGCLLSEAVVDAVEAATAFVAAGGAGVLDAEACRSPAGGERPADPAGLVRAVRAAGGTVVATGGCFDLLHAGHTRMLASARGLGDCLVVCINSDASVRRLKGADRPLVPAEDRRAVLASLACVDAVAVFDEDTPERILAELRPDVWAKGADYALADMPEARLVASWGGQAVVLPYLDGRSTSRLLGEASRRVS